ncbi:MAG: hypothetical protein AAB436_00285 [Patescibacteria group bacterium]
MTAGAEQSLFLSVYAEVTEHHQGAFVPEEAALSISEAAGVDVADVRAILDRPPAEDSMYPDATRFLPRLIEAAGQYISIWTQGEMVTSQGEPGYQVRKVDHAGISGLLDPSWQVQNSPAGLPNILGHIYNKSSVLQPIISPLAEGDFGKIVIVDDKPVNHVLAHQALQDQGWDGTTEHYLMARAGINGSDRSEFPFDHTVESFEEVPAEPDVDGRTLWLIDLDYTLIDHKRVIQLYSRRIDELSGITDDIRPQ